MRIRSSHIVVAIVALIGTFFLLVWLRASSAKVGSDQDIIQQARELRAEGAGSQATEGLLPSADVALKNIPVLDATTDLYDMGEITNTGPTTEELEVYNRGNGPLEITEVRTSCGCTIGQFDTNSVKPDGRKATIIPPGGEAPMKITVDPFRIPGFASRKTLTIYSNDPKRPTVMVDVAAHVRPEFTMAPPILDFGTVQRGDSPEASIIIRQEDAPDLLITGVEPGRPTLAGGKIEEKEGEKYTLALHKRPESAWASPDHPEWEIAVKLSPDLPVGAFHDSFTILSNVRRVSRLTYKISANVEAFYTVSPTMLGVRNAVDPGQERIGTAVVKADRPFQLEDVAITGSGLTVSTRPGDSSDTEFIDVGVTPDAHSGLHNETLSFTVKSANQTVHHTMRVFASVKG